MFVSAAAHHRVCEQLASERGKREILQQQVVTQHTMVGFLATRVNQLEVERSALLKRFANLDIPTANLVVTPPPSIDPKDPRGGISGLDDMFRHIEDDEARRLGLLAADEQHTT
jgi:plasmid stability protein